MNFLDFWPQPPVRVERKQCPGDGVRGCLAEIPADRKRCFFCSRTVELALAHMRSIEPVGNRTHVPNPFTMPLRRARAHGRRGSVDPIVKSVSRGKTSDTEGVTQPNTGGPSSW